MAKYIMALDAGTTSNRCILFDREGNICSMAQKEFRQMFPNPGWVEHDANEIWSTQLGVAVEAMSKIGASAKDIAGIGITNQRETVIVWDKETGEPVYHAIVWQCRRTSEMADELKAKGLEENFRAKTGLIIDAYFSATKLKWILDNVEGVRERAERGEILFGTVETWLIWKLTKGRVHVTDYSNASRTMLFNINTLTWDEDILRELNIPVSMLPEPKLSSCVYGYTDPGFFGGSIPIAGAAVQWLRDGMKLIDSAEDSEYMARKVHGTHGCYVVPAFTGLGAPHWDQYARGTIVGITRGTNKNHIIRATLESIAYQVCDVIDAMKADAGIDLRSLKVDGGASANNFLMQFQADMLDKPVNRPSCLESTALGAAYLAGLAVGYWENKEDVKNNVSYDRVFTPEMGEEERATKRKGWNKAVKYAFGWAKDEEEEE